MRALSGLRAGRGEKARRMARWVFLVVQRLGACAHIGQALSALAADGAQALYIITWYRLPFYGLIFPDALLV
jgi:hypothetical protein